MADHKSGSRYNLRSATFKKHPYHVSSAQKKMGNDSHAGMELGSEEKAEENGQFTPKLKIIRENGMWKTGNEQGKNKSKRIKRQNKTEGDEKIKRFKRPSHAPAQSENNANNSEDNNNISQVTVHNMATEDELNNIIQEQVSDSIVVPPVPEEESVRAVLRKASSESFVAFLDHDYAIKPIPLTKGGRSKYHQNLESAKQEREDESDDEVEILKEIPAGNLKMNLNEMKVEIEDGEILAVTDEEPNKTRNENYDDNAVQVIIKEEPENEDDIKNYIESLPVPKVLNSKTTEENAAQEDNVDLGRVMNDGGNIVLNPVTGIFIPGEVESPQAWDNLQVKEKQQNCISVQEQDRQGDNDMRESQKEGNNDMRESQKETDNDMRESQKETDNDMRESQKETDNDMRESQKEGDNEMEERQQQSINDTRERQQKSVKDMGVGEQQQVSGVEDHQRKSVIVGREHGQERGNEMREDGQRGVNEVGEHGQQGVNVVREDVQRGVNEVGEHAQQHVNVVREHGQKGINVVVEDGQQGVNVVGEDGQQRINEVGGAGCRGVCGGNDRIKIKMEIEMSTGQFVQVASVLPNIVAAANVQPQ